MLQEKLEQYQKLYNERLVEEEQRIQRKKKEQIISKIIASILAQILIK